MGFAKLEDWVEKFLTLHTHNGVRIAVWFSFCYHVPFDFLGGWRGKMKLWSEMSLKRISNESSSRYSSVWELLLWVKVAAFPFTSQFRIWTFEFWICASREELGKWQRSFSSGPHFFFFLSFSQFLVNVFLN